MFIKYLYLHKMFVFNSAKHKQPTDFKYVCLTLDLIFKVEQPQQPAPVLNLEETEEENIENVTKPIESGMNSNAFSIQLTRDQHDHYGTQFDGDSNDIPSKLI